MTNPVEWNPWPEGAGPDGIFLPGFAGPALVESVAVLEAVRDSIPQGGRFAEFGTWCGVTAGWVARERPDAKVVAVDAFHGPPGTTWSRHQMTVINLLHRPNASMWFGTIADFCEPLAVQQFDCVLVDADHSEDGCFRDLAFASRIVKSQGSILVHDYGNIYHQGVQAAVDKFISDGQWRITHRVASLAILRLAG